MTEDAFARRFYADRAELDALGIQLRVDKPADGFSEQENYSLAPEAFHLPAIAFTDDEHAALQTALSLLDGEFAYAEPLRLALQQITWGRPSPLDSAAQRSVALGITASAGGAELSARLAKIDTAITAASGSSSSTSRCSPARSPRAASIPTCCCSRAASSTSSATPTSAAPCACSGSRASAARSPTPPRPSTTSSAPPTSTRASTRTASRGSSARPSGTAEIGVSDRIAWHVERNFGPYGEIEDGVFHTDYAIPRLVIQWALGYGEHARIVGPPELADEARERLDAIVERHTRRAVHQRRRGHAARPRRHRGRGADRALAPGGGDPSRALRPAGHARVGPDRRRPRGPPAEGHRGHRPPEDLRAGAARGHLGAQRRQLRRRRLRDLRRGPGRRGRDRHRALLRHLRPPGAAAADRGATR